MVKRYPRDPKIGMQSRFGSNSIVEFDSKIPKNFGWPKVQAATILAEKTFSADFGVQTVCSVVTCASKSQTFFDKLCWKQCNVP